MSGGLTCESGYAWKLLLGIGARIRMLRHREAQELNRTGSHALLQKRGARRLLVLGICERANLSAATNKQTGVSAIVSNTKERYLAATKHRRAYTRVSSPLQQTRFSIMRHHTNGCV
jgi:hypothetical protein